MRFPVTPKPLEHVVVEPLVPLVSPAPVEKKTDKVLVAATKWLHVGGLHGHVNSAGGVIALSEEYSMKIMAVGPDYRVIELYRHAIGKAPITQSYQVTKKVVVEKAKKKDEPLGATIEVEQDVEGESVL